MKVAIMQPYLFPYLGYFQLIKSVDKFVIFDDVNFINRGWINRNNILLSGNPFLLTLPLDKASQNKLIFEIGLASDDKWRKKFLRTIESAYKKTPFFSEVFQIVESAINSNAENISQLNLSAIKAILSYLNIKTEIVHTSSIYQNKDLKGQERIIDICKREKADIYINPIGGKDIYSKDAFTSHGIELLFLRPALNPYQQTSTEFIPGLSIIDVLMYNSPEKTLSLLNDYSYE